MPREKKPKQRTMSQMEPADVAMAIDQWLEQTGQLIDKDNLSDFNALCHIVPSSRRRRYAPVVGAYSQVRLRRVRPEQEAVLMERLPWVYARMAPKDPDREPPEWMDADAMVRPIYLHGHILPIMRLLVGWEKESTYFRALATYRTGIGFYIARDPKERRDFVTTSCGPWLNLF